MPNLYGTILTPSLTPIPEGSVIRFTRNQEVASGGTSVWSTGRAQTTTDSNGRFGPMLLAPGLWIVEWLHGYQQNRIGFEMPSANRNWELGYLLNPDGIGLVFTGGVLKLLNVDTGEYHPVDVDTDGQFRVYSPDTVLTVRNYDIEATTSTLRIMDPDETPYPITWTGSAEDDGELTIGAASGTVTGGNYRLSDWLEIRNPDEATYPFRKLFLVGARDSAQWALGPATVGSSDEAGDEIAGTDPVVDSLTWRYNGHTYRQEVVGETEEGVPIVQWVKVT